MVGLTESDCVCVCVCVSDREREREKKKRRFRRVLLSLHVIIQASVAQSL